MRYILRINRRRNDRREVIGGLFPSSSAQRVITETFEMMEVAEQELRRFKVDKRPGVFMLLQPTSPIRSLSLDVYRSHVREILTRLKDGRDTRLATDAEILGAISKMSLKAPLNMTYTSIMALLSKRVIGYNDGDVIIHERYKGEMKAHVSDMRRRFSVEERTIKA